MTESPSSAGRPAVFLDRDGTLNVEREAPLRSPEQIELIPGAARAVKRLNDAGYAVVVVTNQSAVGRGWMDEEQLAAVHRELERQLAEDGARIDLLLYCPDHPTEGRGRYRRDSDWRKPGSGMLREAARRLLLDLDRSWIVGDAERDLLAGTALGLRAILVATGKGRQEWERLRAAGPALPELAEDLPAAVDHLMRSRAASG